jgi:hypothetical protein
MTQKQQYQPMATPVSQNYVYAIARIHEQSEWLLVSINPRTWSKSTSKALIFHTIIEASDLINHIFTPVEQPHIYTRQISVGN